MRKNSSLLSALLLMISKLEKNSEKETPMDSRNSFSFIRNSCVEEDMAVCLCDYIYQILNLKHPIPLAVHNIKGQNEIEIQDLIEAL
jgi:hypothetical protein